MRGRTLACRLWHLSTLEQSGRSSIGCIESSSNVVNYKSLLRFGCGQVDGARSFTRTSCASEEAEEREVTDPKVLELADRITELNMLEVSDLTEVLRKRLNIQGGGMPMGFAMPAAAGAVPAAAPAADAGAGAAQEEKTDFTVKLSGFEASSKIKVIKEVRAITDLGLKEAKELVEGSPAVIKEGLSKEDAEELKAKLEAAGGQISLE
ncbi:54S ribosomal protein L12 [Picochlorum sp. SENEW3]|nr:54S ribosomal protein L12 [Picochlorum sp. SENEW3]WPT18502.1 54S ribosomal protein L12 [Picochlorum sp. SENEW3]